MQGLPLGHREPGDGGQALLGADLHSLTEPAPFGSYHQALDAPVVVVDLAAATALQGTAGYGQANKGWRWTGAAKWSPHDLRHAAACWMLFDLKLDPAVVADKLGHANPDFTIKRYIGVRGPTTPTSPPWPSPMPGSRRHELSS